MNRGTVRFLLSTPVVLLFTFYCELIFIIKKKNNTQTKKDLVSQKFLWQKEKPLGMSKVDFFLKATVELLY